jgi:hypothetical protein
VSGSNSRPLAFVDYRCGHSTPVRGNGGQVDRDCPDCVKLLGCLADMLNAAHPSAYCDCDMCQSRIP